MKRTFILVFLFSLLSVPEMKAQFEGTFGLGVHAGYGAEINSLGGGIDLHYYHTNKLRFAPSFTWFFQQKNDKLFMIDADVHYVLPVSLSASLYPIAGVSYSYWSHDTVVDENLYEKRKVKHRLGANLGVGIQHDIAYRVRANFEIKYQSIPDYSQVVFSAGIGFWF